MANLLVSGKYVLVFIAAFMLMDCLVVEATDLFMTAEDCAFCHSSTSTALVDSEGTDLSIPHDWSSSMMANSFRDPVFRAKMASEKMRTPQLSMVIEDKCLTCHTPMTRTQYVRDQKGLYKYVSGQLGGLAEDGVSCTLCHQIQDDGLGEMKSFSGQYVIKDERNIFGPYREVFGNPMVNHVGYDPVFGNHVNESELCASCHTLFTPYVDNKGEIAGEFPEQTPYFEWLNSVYSKDGGRSCQDCHMPRTDEPIKISNRPPWLKNSQSPFWAHHFTGGNSFVLEMMRLNPEQTAIIATDDDFQLTIQRTEQRLAEDTVALSVRTEKKNQDMLLVEVTVENKTGHKFPTGYPARRSWLRLTVEDKMGTVLFDSGRWDEQGRILGISKDLEPHYDLITESSQVQIYQAIMKDVDGQPTNTLMRASGYVKDNRIPPEGYRSDGPMVEFTGVAGGAVTDANFNGGQEGEGTGIDRVTYLVDSVGAVFPLKVQARMLYQSIPPAFIEDLSVNVNTAITQLSEMYQGMKKDPVVLETITQIVEQ